MNYPPKRDDNQNIVVFFRFNTPNGPQAEKKHNERNFKRYPDGA